MTGPRKSVHLIRWINLRGAGQQLGAELKVLRELDPVEAPDRLARHATDEVRRRLHPVESAAQQALRVNRVIRDLDVGTEGDEIALPPQLLYGIKGQSATGTFWTCLSRP